MGKVLGFEIPTLVNVPGMLSNPVFELGEGDAVGDVAGNLLLDFLGGDH
jgi:hypothetical protein